MSAGRAGGATGSPSTVDARQGNRVAARERHLPAEPRAEPAREQQRVRARAFDRDPLDPADSGPALGERRPPRKPTPPGEIGDDDPVEEAGERLVRAGDAVPFVRIDDEAVADVDDLGERLTVPVGAPAPAAVRREVGDQQREDDGRRMTGRLAAQPELDHLGQHLAPVAGREVLDDGVGLDAAPPPRHGNEEDRARRVSLGQAGEDAFRPRQPLGRGPDDVRHRARAELGLAVHLLAAAVPRELPLHLGDDAHQWRLQERPSRWSSSSARAGPQLPAA